MPTFLFRCKSVCTRSRLFRSSLLAALLVLVSLPVSANSLKTFSVSVNSWVTNPFQNNSPDPIAASSSVLIDVTAGRLVSSNVIATGFGTLGFVSQQSGSGYTELIFAGGGSDIGGNNVGLQLNLFLPVSSLVGYTGGNLCDAANPCATVSTTEVLTCSSTGTGCQSSEIGTFSANTGSLAVLTVVNPVPVVNSVSPSTVAPGGPAFTLKVAGGNFLSSSAVVNWNGSPRPTGLATAGYLTASISASDIATAGTAVITVTNPAPGGGTSNPVYFHIAGAQTPTSFNTFRGLEVDQYKPRNSNAITGDFNGDGKQDIVAYQGGTIFFLPGKGDGTFPSGTWVTSPGPALPPSTAADQNTYLASADFNGDGKLDLILMNANGTFIALGNGSGAFQLLSTSLTDVIPYGAVGIGDFNKDGFLDLAYALSSGVVAVQLGNGDGTFTPAPSSVSIFGSSATRVLGVADFNHDGNLDLLVFQAVQFPRACANPTGADLYHYYVSEIFGLGNGGFYDPVAPVTPAQSVCSLPSTANLSAAFADFNNDGSADIAYHEVRNGIATLYVNLGAPATAQVPFQISQPVPANFPLTFGPVLAGDFNGDGKPDVITGNQIFTGNGDGSFTALTPSPSPNVQIVQLADFNGDGQLDPLALGYTAPNFSSTDLQVLLQVPAAPDFGGSLTPQSQSVVPGNSVSYSGTITALNGFTGAVSLSASGLPSGVTATLNPTSITGGSGSFSLQLSTTASAAAGSYVVTITGTSGALAHSTSVTLVVTSTVGDFTASLSSGSDSVANITYGQTARFTFQVTPSGGFTGDVTPSISGLPAGTTASFNPAVITGGSGSSTLSVVTTTATPTGIYNLTVTNTSGSLSHSGQVTLGVRSDSGDFRGTIGPTPSVTTPGGIAPYNLNIVYTNGFTPEPASACLHVVVTGIPSGVPYTFVCPAGINPDPGEQDNLNIPIPLGVAPGSYTLVVTASGAGRIRSTTAQLLITPLP